MSSPSSGRRRGRPAQSSAASTPSRSSNTHQGLHPQSSPTNARQQAQNATEQTPRSSRRLRESAVPTSSPLFFQSSPTNGSRPAAHGSSESRMEPSSPSGEPQNAADGETTPRASRRPIAGTLYYQPFEICNLV